MKNSNLHLTNFFIRPHVTVIFFSFTVEFTFVNAVHWDMSGLWNISLLNWLTTCSKFVNMCGNWNTAIQFLGEGSEAPDICCEMAVYSFSPYVRMGKTNFKFGHWWKHLIFARCVWRINSEIRNRTLDNDQLGTHVLYFTIRLLQSSTCFEHIMLETCRGL